MPQAQGQVQVSADRLRKIDAYWRAANYLGAAQLYLRGNVLLRQPIKPEDIKGRLVGCWGTQPGLNLICAHLNRLIQDTDANILLVVGPSHGAPAILANLYLEGTLRNYDDLLTLDEAGLTQLVRRFGWPDGPAVHLAADTPGAIHEGSELGHSLAHAFGAAFDNPDLIVACIIGDGEAETGSLAAAWHSTKCLNPVTCGAVLPILHLNSWEQSGPAILGRMDNDELESLFAGYGYDIGIVSGDDPMQVHEAMWQAMDWAHQEIRALQDAARAGQMPDQPTWPMLVIRTAKGWTGPREVDGRQVEGTFRSHGLPVADPAGNAEHLAILEQWLHSYRPEELFDASGALRPEVVDVCPKGDRRIGMNAHANGGQLLVDLKLPDVADHAVVVTSPGHDTASTVATAAKLLRDVFRANAQERNFRLFCPDEIPGNQMDAVLEATGRAWLWPIGETDEFLSEDGRVMEVLNQQLCQGWLEGYLLTGRHGVFACDEAHLPVLGSMFHQYARWLTTARQTPWRRPVASLNYLTTSHVWSCGASSPTGHQGPDFLSQALHTESVARAYLPPDANCLLCVMQQCLRDRGHVNLIVAASQPVPQWLDIEAARQHCQRGISTWHWASHGEEEPDVVLACAGDVPTIETLAAAWLLRRELPDLHVRVVNVVDPLTLATPETHPNGLDEEAFDQLFNTGCPVIFAFHGYPRAIHELLYGRPGASRFHVHGYMGLNRVTTPFGMRMLNRISRFDLAIGAIQQAHRLRDAGNQVIEEFRQSLTRHEQYIREHGADMPEIGQWRWE